jgi:hypothetical protein
MQNACLPAMYSAFVIAIIATSSPMLAEDDDAKSGAAHARELVRQTHKADFAKATSAKEQQALAIKLIGLANRSLNNSVRREALLAEALDLTIESRMIKAALAIADNWSADPVEGLDQQIAVLKRLQDLNLNGEDRDLVSDFTVQLISNAVSLGQFERALEAMTMYEALTSRFPEKVQKSRDAFAESQRTQITDLVAAQREYKHARETLKESPDDQDANRIVGRYDYLIRHDPQGLARLRRVKDELGDLLLREEKSARDVTSLIALGDAWMALADQASPAYRPHLLGHASNAYGQVGRKGTAAQQERAITQLSLIASQVKAVIGTSKPPELAGAPLVKRPTRRTKSPAEADSPESVTSREEPVKPVPSAPKRTPKPAGTFAIEGAVFTSNGRVEDLTLRMQKAAKEGLLVVFVEPVLSSDRKNGTLTLRIKQDGRSFDQNFAHRQFVFLDNRPIAEFPQQGLVILDAFYGTGIWGEGKMVDVKEAVKSHLQDNRVSVPVKTLVAKSTDPASGLSKVVIVRYAFNGRIGIAMFEEHKSVELP